MMKYFAYGSNMDPDRMKSRGILSSKREHAVLEGFRLEFNKLSARNPNEGYANIIADKDERVEGILYEIEDKDLRKLDRHEGYPNHYTRVKVSVKLDSGQTLEAITYIANPNMIREGLKPTRDYLNHLLKGCDLLSKAYREKLNRVETLD